MRCGKKYCALHGPVWKAQNKCRILPPIHRRRAGRSKARRLRVELLRVLYLCVPLPIPQGQTKCHRCNLYPTFRTMGRRALENEKGSRGIFFPRIGIAVKSPVAQVASDSVR